MAFPREGDRLVIEMPGGGGMAPAAERDPDAVRRDVKLGYLSAEAALRDYGEATKNHDNPDAGG